MEIIVDNDSNHVQGFEETNTHQGTIKVHITDWLAFVYLMEGVGYWNLVGWTITR